MDVASILAGAPSWVLALVGISVAVINSVFVPLVWRVLRAMEANNTALAAHDITDKKVIEALTGLTHAVDDLCTSNNRMIVTIEKVDANLTQHRIFEGGD
jgi:hypothetical protein